MRQVGDRVFVTADNFGSEATIIETRESTGSPASHYKVQTDTNEAFWAFDFEISNLGKDSRPDTLEHIGKVMARIHEFCDQMEARAKAHDASKLEEPEKSGYDQLVTHLANVEYGTDEYRAALAEARPVIEHHYAANTHHPEHWPDGIAGMSLLDIVEMLCDWKAASERTKQGSIHASLAHNKERFGISDQLASILENTVRELGW